jgi:hypothetical protein
VERLAVCRSSHIAARGEADGWLGSQRQSGQAIAEKEALVLAEATGFNTAWQIPSFKKKHRRTRPAVRRRDKK